MSDQIKERVSILQAAIARGKKLRPEHQEEYDRYVNMGLAGSAGRSIPDSAAKRYEEDLNIFGAMKRARGGFQDDYAGNTWTGETENIAQALFSGIGTPGQRDWWADFRSADNLIRNQLFGSALTEHERKAYEGTTVKPSMDPKEVRANIDRRFDIVRAALKRRTEFLKANGYNPRAVDALAGEYMKDFIEQQPADNGAPARQSDDDLIRKYLK